MLTLQTRLRPNQEEIAAKVVDGEAIMINLSTGIYYSMDETGALVWELLAAGHSLEEVSAALARRYDVPGEQAQADVARLGAELLEENLVTLSDVNAAPAGLPGPVVQARTAYTAPKLDIFRDIGNLIALDPPMPGLTDLRWSEPSGGAPAPTT
jgi:coenzyme PQQ synthesis protein D (PqqD)